VTHLGTLNMLTAEHDLACGEASKIKHALHMQKKRCIQHWQTASKRRDRSPTASVSSSPLLLLFPSSRLFSQRAHRLLHLLGIRSLVLGNPQALVFSACFISLTQLVLPRLTSYLLLPHSP
jgi:hypothetical protein